MSYIALARRWRPKTFTQLLGQAHLTTALINSLTKGRIHHAYLFTGTRGVGKTSVARLLAKSLNCEVGISANPCLRCTSCIAFEEGRCIDLIEIDGASKTKVEDIREILENVQYAPTASRFKIYLIDEVHMLSQHSFNALLKTLEEPPEHVKFLLATTDPQKLPITVLSRCLQFNLKYISPETIEQHLSHILYTENIKFENQALVSIAKAAKGSIRDALSLLDQAIVGCNNNVTYTEVNQLLGYTQKDYALLILKAIINSNPEQLIQISRDIQTDNGGFGYVLEELINYLHKVAIKQAIPNNHTFDIDDNEINLLATQLTPENTQLIYQIALKGAEDIILAPTMRIGFEVLLLRMYTFIPVEKQTPPKTTSDKKIDSSVVVKPEQKNNSIQTNAKPESTLNTKTNHQPAISETALNPNDFSWSDIIPKLKLQGLTLTAAENSQLINVDNEALILRTDLANQSIFTTNVIKKLENSLIKFYKKNIKLTIEYGKLENPSPAEEKKDIFLKNQEAAIKSLEEDQFFKQLQDEFSAELVKNSIASLKD